MKMCFAALAAIFLVSNSNFAFAAADEDIARVCRMTGIAKLALQAQAYGCTIDLNKVYASEGDNRWYNPSKYVWYTAPGDCKGMNQLTKLVQYYNRQCF